MARPPPGPRGEHLGRLNYLAWRADAFGFLTTLAEQHGDVVGFDLGRSPCILVNGVLQVRELLLKRESRLRKPEFVKDSNRGYWGEGLTTLEGDDWHARRQILRPSFRARRISSRLSVVAQFTAEMLNGWAPTSETDLLRELRNLTARIAARVVLDAEVEGYQPTEGRAGVLSFPEAYGETYTSIPGGDPTAPLVMVRPRAPNRMDAVIRIIDERIASEEEREDVLTDLVQARLPNGDRLTREEIVGEVVQMLYAGHLNVPSALVNFWRDIGAHGAAERIAAEAEHLCVRGGLDSASLSRSYCLAALKESMRLHPPAPLLYREVESPFEIGGFEFARDAAAWVSPQLLHHDARYFPEPLRFLPERFQDGRLAGVSASAYLPFGAGPRTCIGNHLALHQMTLIALLTACQVDLTPLLFGSQGTSARARTRNAT
jgi:enediyne biosynthesis protein E7